MPTEYPSNHPMSMSCDVFIAGSESRIEDIVIDDIFAKDFREALDDLINAATDEWNELEIDDDAIVTRSIIDDKLVFVDTRSTLLLVDRETGRPIGGYLGCDLVLEYDYRGRGLGKEIVLEYFMRNHSLPVWNLDEPSYSTDGIAAHQAAWRWSKKVFDKKMEEIKNHISINDIKINLNEDKNEYKQF